MFRTFILPTLSIAGLVLAVLTVNAGSQTVTPAEPVAPPAMAPFDNYIAGAGLLEASTENIAIGALVPGVVTEVYVTPGQRVERGAKLFEVDQRDLKAQLGVTQSQVELARRRLDRLKAQTRQEDLPPLAARVSGAKAQLANAQREMDRLRRIESTVSPDEMDRVRLEVDVARANLEAAEAELDRARVNVDAWSQDVLVAEAEIEAAQQQVRAIEIEIERRIVRAPITGKLLQVKTRVGEYASAGSTSQPLMLMGDIDTLHVRVDIDENDAWRFTPETRARASVRGNSRLVTELTFVRIEPYVVPKRSLTGESSERVDTRVLQAIYAFDSQSFSAANEGAAVYAGQQMDVFIETRR